MRTLLPAIGVAIATLASPCLACTIVTPSISVGPDFRVKLDSRYDNLKGGQRLSITSHRGGRTLLVETDEKGIAHVRGLRPGAYSVHVEMDPGASTGVEVKSGDRRIVTIPLAWPSRPPIEVGSLQGSVHLFDTFPDAQAAQIDLAGTTPSRLIQRVQTSEDGRFRFKEVAPGLYFLGLRTPASAGIEWVPVTVTPEAKTDHLDLQVVSSSCGAWIVDQSHCPRPSGITVKDLAVTVQDPSGAVIPNASIILVQRGSVKESVRTDARGGFAFSQLAAGAYELKVTASGFGGLWMPIQIDPALARQRPITVKLSVGGCSQVDFGGQE